jgi:hypothetical protein
MRWLSTLLDRPTTRPKSSWLLGAATLFALVAGGIGILVVLATGSRVAHVAAIAATGASWLIGAACIVLSGYRQLTGAYRDLASRPLRDQVW